MEIEKQVCTLEQAKRLKELGVAQNNSIAIHKSHPIVGDVIFFRVGGVSGDEWAAFSVAELGYMLPNGSTIFKDPNGCFEWSCDMIKMDWNDWHEHATEAEARAAMLIHLIENNLIPIDEVNKMLKPTSPTI